MVAGPAEILDHIVDLLDGSRTPLGNCCLASKSWIPRTRKHLLADIRFRTAKSLRLWKETFPDPSTSPARHAKALSIGGPQVVTAADVEAASPSSQFFDLILSFPLLEDL